MAWLERQDTGLAADRAQAVQERLYVYISELAKQQRGRFPSPGDSAAQALFRLTAWLGSVGADRIARALSTDSSSLPPSRDVPHFTLKLSPPSFALISADKSWGVCFPYYFMAAPAGQQRPANGVLTDIVVLSTLFAPDQGPMGSSQATIFLVTAAPGDSIKHVDLWRNQLGVSPAPAPPEDSTGAWFTSAPGEEVRRLVVVRRLRDKVVVAAYLGMAGTFDTNRPHFFNVLSTLRSSRCST